MPAAIELQMFASAPLSADIFRGLVPVVLPTPGPPIPAPTAFINALQSATITVASSSRSGFQLTFAISSGSTLLREMLPGGKLSLFARIILTVTVFGTAKTLIDGVITRVEEAPSPQPGLSVLTVTGEDLSLLMDLVDLTGLVRYPGMPVSALVALVLAKYLPFGMIPKVIPPIVDITMKIPTDSLEHKGTDLAYLKKLATDCGYIFYLNAGPRPGMTEAYWGPEVRFGEPQPALTLNFDANDNVQSLRFTYDGMTSKMTAVRVFDPVLGKVPLLIPIPAVSLIKPPLAARPTPPVRFEPMASGTAKDSKAGAVANAVLRGHGSNANSADSVTGSGSLNVLRYGRPLASRQLVYVRGANAPFNGLYYVDSVTHNLKRDSYEQSFNLSRNGLLPLSDRVKV